MNTKKMSWMKIHVQRPDYAMPRSFLKQLTISSQKQLFFSFFLSTKYNNSLKVRKRNLLNCDASDNYQMTPFFVDELCKQKCDKKRKIMHKLSLLLT